MRHQLSLLALTSLFACSATRPPVASPTDPTVELAARRAQMIGWLHDYRERGVFPLDASGRPLSVFMDQNGNRCPMAELIHKSGRDDLVAAVVKENNAVRLAEVHEGPLYDWMLASGLTQTEIAMVQGAADIDYTMYQFEEVNTQLAAAKAEVRGKLETAEVALAGGTASGLVVAAQQLGHRHVADLAMAKIAGKVVPKNALPFGAGGVADGPATPASVVLSAMPQRVRFGRRPIVFTTPNGTPVQVDPRGLDSYVGN
jgi:hypothetical protein